MKNKKVLIVLFLLATAAAAAYYYFYYLPNQEPEQGEPATADQGPTTTEYDGQYVSGEVPEDWTIVEYQNGAGSTMLTEGVTYAGLTGLEIKNPDGAVVFKLAGVYGIGGVDSCQKYFQFSDDSAAYLAEIQGINAEVSDPAPTIVDLTTVTHQEYELFGVRVRRIEKKLYWDKTAGDAYFQAACGISERIFNFTNPAFTGDGTSIKNYQHTLNETSPESELLELDAILESLATP
ncbi:hypothetical protein A2V54_01700 [candidate division WWE3 bacterium RBG_19FT_COMBO_53_11]|uniref:Uncharacterized protein n=1 Tax=candidate division WWE3 bacterium RBG_19FT_COMBO_53_11 TaxID=1802613 RepID=A0A1F4UIG5_UNCKA|nr:MAG: hypothetical protein A2155_00355 [candidate division WWE3 bacterium RBG_16_52_45]OGC44765.1 MAG: hypothetical protein A2V54_01700 [candidate division WWE3 bacterium RBG_19FT_COMBO_53_11]